MAAAARSNVTARQSRPHHCPWLPKRVAHIGPVPFEALGDAVCPPAHPDAAANRNKQSRGCDVATRTAAILDNDRLAKRIPERGVD